MWSTYERNYRAVGRTTPIPSVTSQVFQCHFGMIDQDIGLTLVNFITSLQLYIEFVHLDHIKKNTDMDVYRTIALPG